MSGDELRARREALGYSIAAVAAATKIPVRYLQALEEGRIGDLPAGPYAAAYTRAVSAFLGVGTPEVDGGDSQDARPAPPAPLWFVRGTATATLSLLGILVLWFTAVLVSQALSQNVASPTQQVEVSARRRATNVVVTSADDRQAKPVMVVGKDAPIVMRGPVITVEADAVGSLSVKWNGAEVRPRGRTSGPRVLRFVDDAGGYGPTP